MQVEPKQRGGGAWCLMWGALVPNVGHLPPLRMPPLLVSMLLTHLLHPTLLSTSGPSRPLSYSPPGGAVGTRSLQPFPVQRRSLQPSMLASPSGVFGLSSDVRPVTSVPRKGNLSFFRLCLKTGSLGQLWGDSRFLLSRSIAT